jgi:hypothetical protein
VRISFPAHALIRSYVEWAMHNETKLGKRLKELRQSGGRTLKRQLWTHGGRGWEVLHARNSLGLKQRLDGYAPER